MSGVARLNFSHDFTEKFHYPRKLWSLFVYALLGLILLAIYFLLTSNQNGPAQLTSGRGSASPANSTTSTPTDQIGGSSISVHNDSSNGVSRATVNVNGHQIKVNNTSNYSQTFNSPSGTINVSISDHSNSSASNVSNQSSSSLSVGSSN